MKILKKLCYLLTLLAVITTVASCSDDEEEIVITEPQSTPSQLLSSTPWETTNAKNQEGASVALTDTNVSNFVGFAYFKTNGTFTMFNLDNSPKMHGDWSVSADGSTRTITTKDANGNALFTRVVKIIVLTKQEFTYRIYPDANNLSVYYDIIHTPTNHPEP
ncbi:DUF4822 domain-containing protein [Chryseobacterium sp. T16E-39]|uniref:DUF4822 domain-containing protein n=1 Tax=Chryseobacterium sp. T16E-39 TaxID=2015076 RepID=UPI000B5B2526|nr:DUF4822 domain-containing protein [Chryseobacterium sp. T16E-39]ASK31932.1 DUF4822 domain-containing protein [Chryseobacterium sp. T16E-39]